nr:carotenoid 9,10(9',10')-cleavage dioxygenase 1 [Quercus suber]
MLDYDNRLSHSFTAHPKVDPFTGEMFTFGYSQTPPYITNRVISKDGFMYDPVPITISDPIMVEQYQDGSCGGKGGRHLLKLGRRDEESHSKDWARLEDKQIRRWAKC